MSIEHDIPPEGEQHVELSINERLPRTIYQHQDVTGEYEDSYKFHKGATFRVLGQSPEYNLNIHRVGDTVCFYPTKEFIVKNFYGIKDLPNVPGEEWDDEIKKLSNEREMTHGKFLETANCYSRIKAQLIRTSKTDSLVSQELALDMIAIKLARITKGDVNEPDHWKDIAGYAMAVHKELSVKK